MRNERTALKPKEVTIDSIFYHHFSGRGSGERDDRRR